MFNPLNSKLVCSCIMPYFILIRLALYFKKISLSALSGSSRARCSVMTTPAVLKTRSEGTKKDRALSGWDIRYLTISAGTGLEKMAGYPANRNRISGTSLVFLQFGKLAMLPLVAFRRYLELNIASLLPYWLLKFECCQNYYKSGTLCCLIYLMEECVTCEIGNNFLGAEFDVAVPLQLFWLVTVLLVYK